MSRPLNTRGVSAAEPQVNHRKQTWSGNGFHCTLETTSYSTPGFSFSSAGSAAVGNQLSTSRSPQSRVGGLLGTAFNLIDGMMAMQMQQSQGKLQQARTGNRQSGQPIREHNGDDGRMRHDQRRSATKSVFSGDADPATHGRKAPVGSNRHSTGRPSESPSNAQKSTRGSNNNRPQSRSRAVPVVDLTEEDAEDSDDSDDSIDDDQLIEELQSAVNHHRREAKTHRKRLEKAMRQAGVDLAYINSLRNKIKSHEAAYREALEDLNALIADVERDRAWRQPAPGRESSQRQQPRNSAEDIWREFGFSDPDFAPFGTSTVPPRRSAFADFADFTQSTDAFHRSFNGPGVSFSFSTGSRQRPAAAAAASSRPQPSGSAPKSKPSTIPVTPLAPQQRPPPTLLTSAEAKSLYKVYDQRWAQLDHTDPSIPYPARSLLSSGLTTRDTLWSPLTSSPVSTWSDEMVMQANVQAMLLGAAGLAPLYAQLPGTGRVQMSFDKGRASAAQVSTLLAMLKKERTRWHSDRLGRRNGGGDEPNVELQRDERARAVFHAICGLLDAAQS